LYGPSFTAYTWLLVAFGVAMPFRYIGLIFGGALTSAGHQSWRVRALAIAVGVSFILNLALIPVIGVTGALIAVTASWFTNCVLNVLDVDRVFGRVISLRDLFTFVGLAALAFVSGVTVRAVVGGPLGDPIGGITFAGVGLLGMFGPALRRRLRLSPTVDGD
jgi:O-antigen/teichoic acid export membrane protein